LLRGSRVACLARSNKRGGYTTVAEHMPAAHRAHLEWTPTRLIEWGNRVGMATGAVITRLLQERRHPQHGYRACLGMLSLAKRFGNDRLEAACERALKIGAFQVRHVRDVLVNRRDLADAEAGADWTSPLHENVRGSGYYQ